MHVRTQPLRSGRIILIVLLALLLLVGGYLLYEIFRGHSSLNEQEAAVFQANAATHKEVVNTHKSMSKLGKYQWPEWRGPHRDGVSLETDFLLDWPADLLTGKRKLWEQRVGVGFAAVAVADDRVYLLFQDKDQEAVACWEAGTGKELWRFRYPANYTNDYGDGPRATVTVEDDVLYSVGGSGIMHCLKTQPKETSGEVVWRVELLTEFQAPNIRWGVSFSPLVVGDLVYTMPGGPDGNSLAALSKKTGKTVWKTGGDKAGYSSPILAQCAGKPQVLFFTASALVSVAPADGKVYWRYPWETQFDVNVATPIVMGDYVFISSGYNRGCAALRVVPEGGDALKTIEVYSHKGPKAPMRNHFASCVRDGAYLYGYDDNYLSCIELATGKQRWQWKERDFKKGSVLLAAGHLITLSDTGELVLAKADPDKFTPKARLRVFDESPCWSMPVLCNGLLYLRGGKSSQKLICVDLRRS